jgi:hypothetical protein
MSDMPSEALRNLRMLAQYKPERIRAELVRSLREEKGVSDTELRNAGFSNDDIEKARKLTGAPYCLDEMNIALHI